MTPAPGQAPRFFCEGLLGFLPLRRQRPIPSWCPIGALATGRKKTLTCPSLPWLLPWLTRLFTPEKSLIFFGVPTTTISFGFDDFCGHPSGKVYTLPPRPAPAGPVAANASVAATAKTKRNLRVMVGLRYSVLWGSPTETRQAPGRPVLDRGDKACPKTTISLGTNDRLFCHGRPSRAEPSAKAVGRSPGRWPCTTPRSPGWRRKATGAATEADLPGADWDGAGPGLGLAPARMYEDELLG